MQLPQDFRAFDVPTLIAVTDNVQAKLFLVAGREADPVSVISTKREHEAQERVAVKTGAGDMRSGENHEHLKMQEREELYDELNAELTRRLERGEFEALAVCVPEEHMNELKESLRVDLLKVADVWVPKLLTNDDLLDIIAHVQEET
jgi:protein required for attachment to host cells